MERVGRATCTVTPEVAVSEAGAERMNRRPTHPLRQSGIGDKRIRKAGNQEGKKGNADCGTDRPPNAFGDATGGKDESGNQVGKGWGGSQKSEV